MTLFFNIHISTSTDLTSSRINSLQAFPRVCKPCYNKRRPNSSRLGWNVGWSQWEAIIENYVLSRGFNVGRQKWRNPPTFCDKRWAFSLSLLWVFSGIGQKYSIPSNKFFHEMATYQSDIKYFKLLLVMQMMSLYILQTFTRSLYYEIMQYLLQELDPVTND